MLFLAGCGIGIVDPNKPPANLPKALLYFRPKEQFWVVCTGLGSGKTRCEFWDQKGETIAFRCDYALARQLTQSDMKQLWLGDNRGLKFDDGKAIACSNLIAGSSH